MLEEMEQALIRLQQSSPLSRATSDLKQLHDHYIGSLKQISNSIHYPQVMRILAEELVEELSGRFSYLGIPFGDFKQDETPLYWNNYLTAVKSGVILGNEYARFLKADKLATPFLNDSYIDEVEYIDGGYKAMRYAYALSSIPLPNWFSVDNALKSLEEIITAFGFLWFSIVDYAEEQYYAKGA